MKKKLVSVLLCAAMVTGLLAGCGKSGDDSKGKDGEKETITMWCPPLDDNMLENWEPLLK